MATLEDYRTLGRIEGAQHAEIVFANCRGLPREAIEAAQALRAKTVLGRMADIVEAGGSADDCEAYHLAADARFYERIDELTLAAVNGAPVPPPSPPANRKARRARKAKGLH